MSFNVVFAKCWWHALGVAYPWNSIKKDRVNVRGEFGFLGDFAGGLWLDARSSQPHPQPQPDPQPQPQPHPHPQL